MSIASARPFLLPGLEAALREGVARRPWMADGSGTDGTGLTPVLYLSNQQSGSQSVPIVGLKELRRSIEESETPQLLGPAARKTDLVPVLLQPRRA